MIEEMLTAVYAGNAPNRDLFNQTAQQLIGSVYSGYGKELRNLAYNSPDFVKLNELTYNVGVFSAFKKHSQINETVKLLKDAEGNVRKKKDFIKEARKLDDTYNRRYLSAEYNHATTSAQMARRWQDVERTKDLYPNLTYIAIEDGRTRQSHRNWNGITLPIDHPFWEDHYPPNDWGCRCSVRRSDKPADDKGIAVDAMPKLPKQFNINVGKAGKVFDDSHPYFKIPEYKQVAKAANVSLLRFHKKQIIKHAKGKGITKTKYASSIGDIELSNSGLKHAVRGAWGNAYLRQSLFYDIKNVLKNAVWIRKTPDIKNNPMIKFYHYLQVEVEEKQFYLNVREDIHGNFSLYDITESIK